MLETRKDLNGDTQWKVADVWTIETTLLMNKCGVATKINDGQYCSVERDK